MKLGKGLWVLAALVLTASAAQAQVTVFEERVPGGALERVWLPGFNTFRQMLPLTLDASHPAYANPSGDHTVGLISNTVQDSGGLVLTCTDPQGQADYIWEGWMFTGTGNSRRGLVLRANPTNNFTSCYQFVVQQGLFQINFRRLNNQTPTTLGTWFATSLPGGSIPQNTWIHMKVIASANAFRCFINNFELTGGTPILDNPANALLTGFVGTYNFRFDTANIPVYFDDMKLSVDAVVPTNNTSWGRIKALYR